MAHDGNPWVMAPGLKLNRVMCGLMCNLFAGSNPSHGLSQASVLTLPDLVHRFGAGAWHHFGTGGLIRTKRG